MKGLVDRGKRIAEWGKGTIPGKVVLKFGEDRGANWAVLLAWNTLTSIFPIALALAGILGLVLSHVGLRSLVVYQAVVNIIPGNAEDTTAALNKLQHQSGVFFVVGLLGLVWSGSSLFGAMEQAFDIIFHAPPRSFVRQKLMAVVMILLFTVLAGVGVATSTLLPLLQRLPLVPTWIAQSAGVYVVQPVAGILAGVLLFGCMYYAVPNRKQRLSEVWPGALFAGVAYYVLTLLFPLYVAFNKSIDQYGKAFAFLFVVTTFFYFLGLVTMLGVELNAVLYPVPIEQPETADALKPLPARGRRAPDPGEAPRRPGPSRVRTALFGALGGVIGAVAVARHRARRTA